MSDLTERTTPRDARNVCVECFDDADLKRVVRRAERIGRCGFCGSRRVAVMPLRSMAGYLGRLVEANYARAVDELPYESREGGYQGASTSSTWEALFEDMGVPLAGVGQEELGIALAEAIGGDAWCSPNWTTLDPDESLRSSWQDFCTIVKHQRRFFFQEFGRHPHDGVDERTPSEMLEEIGSLIEDETLVRAFAPGLRLYRARPRNRGEHYHTARELGPPPAALALQSNRMNPPGIPMLYGASRRSLAFAEVRSRRASVGRFRTNRVVHLLDLTRLPPIPGFFAGGSRLRRLRLRFLHEFASEIVRPIPRDDRNHVDYLPTQVFTEFLRDRRFGGVALDGVRYPSATGSAGTNVVLFATCGDVVGVAPDDLGPLTRTGTPWLELRRVFQR